MSQFYVPLEKATKDEIITAIRRHTMMPVHVATIEEDIYETRGINAGNRVRETLDELIACKLKTGANFGELAAHIGKREKLEKAHADANREWSKYMYSETTTPAQFIRKKTK